MKKNEVEIGNEYVVKVSGRLVSVKILRESPYGGWIGRNKETGRDVHVRTAARLRYPANRVEAITIQQCVCKQCGRVWFPRKPERPAKCPRCQSFAWDGNQEPRSEIAAENCRSERSAA